MVNTIADFYYFALNNNAKTDAFTQKEAGKWVSTAMADFVHQAKQFSTGLLKLGFEKGDRIAIISNNRTEWHLTDLAFQQLGVITVPIYPNITEADYNYILNDCGAKAVFISNNAIVKKIENIKANLPALKYIYTYNKIEGQQHFSSVFSEQIDETGIEAARNAIEKDDVATLIYTSGTTGNPKGVMLSHQNLVSNVLGSEDRLPLGDNQKALSFLPLCHVFERMLDYLYIYRSVSIYYAESIETIGENILEVKPNMFATVPRLLEKVYDKIVAKGSSLSGIKKGMFFWALNLGLKYDPMVSGGAWYNLQLNLANKLVFSKWRAALGGNIKALVSGGAALQPRLARVFTAAQIPVLEGYGLSETSPVISVNSLLPNGTMIGSVGMPLSNVEVKLAEDGEILVKGPSIMKGYYNKPELTAEVINAEGYFHTGDIGKLVDGKYLKITDRKKEIFKTSGGKYIAPQVMENKFKESQFIEQVMVVGEGEKMPAAIIQPNFSYLSEWCKRHDIVCLTNDEMVCNEQVLAKIVEEMQELNKGFANYEQIKRFELVATVWGIDSGELTPTLKLKRKIILEKYKALYQKIYK